MTRWEFLEDAMRRFEVGECCYTLCEDNRLLACVWLRSNAKAAPVSVSDKAVTEAPQLRGFYGHPLGQSRLQDFLKAVAATAAKDYKEGELYVQTSTQDKALCQALEIIGFKVKEKINVG